MIFGLILIILGLLIFLSRFEIHLFAFVFPVGLIVLGTWLIMRHRERERQMQGSVNFRYFAGSQAGGQPSGAGPYSPPPPPPPPPPGQGATWSTGTQQTWSSASPHAEAGKLRYSKFLGDMYIDCANVNLQNVEISMFVGDLQVNLKGGKMAPGLNRMIITGFLGDVMVFVPNGMPVYCHCSEFAGDLEVMGKRSSGFGNTLDSQTTDYESAESKLYIAASHFIGDIRVYVV